MSTTARKQQPVRSEPRLETAGTPKKSADILIHSAVLQEHQRLMLATRVGGLGVWDYDIQRDLITCDEQWYRITGRSPANPVRSLADMRDVVHPDDADRATEVELTAAELLAGKGDYGMVFRIIRPGGELRWVRSVAGLIEDENHVPLRAVGFITDITDDLLAEQRLQQLNAMLAAQNEELSRQAMVDPLTSIANRRRFDREIDQACAQALRDGEAVALAMFDIDHFKAYNDHLGHAQGDVALKAVAEVVASAAWRPYDLAARYGGEEFVLLLPGVADPRAVLERVMANLAALALPHPASSAGPHVTVSCGCAVLSDPAELSPENLLLRADAALYRAKEAGRDRIVMSGAGA